MLTFSVTLHNIPEGMAVGVCFAGFLSENAGIALLEAIVLAIGIFFVVPYFISSFFQRFIEVQWMIALLEGIIRLAWEKLGLVMPGTVVISPEN